MNRNCQLGFALVVTVLAACGGGGGSKTTDPGTGTGTGTGGTDGTCGDGGVICVLGTAFSPVDITISNNGSVTFTPKSAVAHNIVFDVPIAAGVTDVGAFGEANVSRTFTTTGTFPYHCTIHGGVGTGMHGTIKVQ